MADLSLQDWQRFLRARIEQEQGGDEKALQVFDELHAKYPSDPHINSSRAYALSRLGRDSEAAVSQIAARYSELGRTLVGRNDRPEAWTEQLQALLGDTEAISAKNAFAASAVAW